MAKEQKTPFPVCVPGVKNKGQTKPNILKWIRECYPSWYDLARRTKNKTELAALLKEIASTTPEGKEKRRGGKEIRVAMQPWSGSLPYFYVEVRFTTIGLNSNTKRSWWVYRNFKLKVLQNEKWHTEALPPWTFLLSNGPEEVFLYPNADDILLTARSKARTIETWLKLTRKEAQQLSSTLDEEVFSTNFGFRHSKPETVLIQPLGIAVHFTATRIKFTDEPERK